MFFCLVLLVPLGIWELFKSDVLGVIHFRKLPCNLKIHPWKRWFLCWKPPLSGSTLNFGAKFCGLEKWAIRAWRWITNETRNRRSRVVVFSLRETAVDFWSHFKNGQKGPILSATKDKQHQLHLHLPWGISTLWAVLWSEVPICDVTWRDRSPAYKQQLEHVLFISRWWFQVFLFILCPEILGKMNRFWHIFFGWVETTQTFTQGVL